MSIRLASLRLAISIMVLSVFGITSALAQAPTWGGSTCAAGIDRPEADTYPFSEGWQIREPGKAGQKSVNIVAPPSLGAWICGEGYTRKIDGSFRFGPGKNKRDSNRQKVQEPNRPLAARACGMDTPECATIETARFLCKNFHPDTPQVQSYEIWKGGGQKGNYLVTKYLRDQPFTANSQFRSVICQEYCSPWTVQMTRDSLALKNAAGADTNTLVYSQSSNHDAAMQNYAELVGSDLAGPVFLKQFFTMTNHGNGKDPQINGTPVSGKFIQTTGHVAGKSYTKSFSFPNSAMTPDTWYKVRVTTQILKENKPVDLFGDGCSKVALYYRINSGSSSDESKLEIREF